MTNLCYLYDGSWDGLLTAVFRAYEKKQNPVAVLAQDGAQLQLHWQSVYIETDETLSRRVESGLIKKLGSPFLKKIGTAFLSMDMDKGTIIYHYIHAGLEIGRQIYTALAHPAVLEIDRICLHISREAHLLLGFVRFSRMENGIYFSKITPKNSVVPLLMPHFADRFSDQPFIIYDERHGIAGIYDLSDWNLVETSELNLPPLSDDEKEYRKLWKLFYNSVAIAERTNPKCRRNHMPKRYWENLTEFLP